MRFLLKIVTTAWNCSITESAVNLPLNSKTAVLQSTVGDKDQEEEKDRVGVCDTCKNSSMKSTDHQDQSRGRGFEQHAAGTH